MGVFFWQYDLEPEFPLRVLEYETSGSGDLMHSHDYLEIALCLDGTGTFKFGQQHHEIEPGDIFLVDNLEAHVAHSEPGVRLRLMLVLFLPEFIAAPGCSAFDSAYLSPFVDTGFGSPRIDHRSPVAADLRSILLELQTAAGGRSVADRYVADATLRRFLAAIIKHRGEVTVAAATAPDPQHLGPALAYVGDHFREAITLEQVAETMHISASRARHLFKELTTVGFKEYVTKLRLAEAKRLLLKTDFNVCEVAVAVGYTNIHQFYKVFHRYTRMSPADYRRAYRVETDPRPQLARLRPLGLAIGAEEQFAS